MLNRNELKTWILSVFLFFNGIVFKIKVALGLEKMKYGIYGHFVYKGVHLSTFVHSKEHLKACEEYDRFRPDDVLIITHIKSGTHFTAGIVRSIYEEKGLIQKTNIDGFTPMEFAPPKILMHHENGESTGPMAIVDNAHSPRILGCHLPWSLLLQKVKAGKVKVIHCMRNPKDVACSAHTFYRRLNVMVSERSWNDFVRNFIAGNVIQGDYFEYMKEWYPNRNSPNLLNIQYEEMVKDLEGHVRRIAGFLGVELTDEQVNRVVLGNTFEKKKKEMGKGHLIYRQAKIGGWKSQFTVEQNELMNERIQQELEGLEDLKLEYE